MAALQRWRDGGLTRRALFRLLGCSIALCCVVSFMQFSAVSTSARGSSPALRGRERGLALAIEAKPESASTGEAAPVAAREPLTASVALESRASATDDVEGELHHRDNSKIEDAAVLQSTSAPTVTRTDAFETDAAAVRSTPLSAKKSSTPLTTSTTSPHSKEEPTGTASPKSPQATANETPRALEATTRTISRARRGIITCLHDRLVPLGVSLIRELRCLGNDERIEVYHCSELTPANVALLYAIDANIVVIDVCQQLIARAAMDAKLARSFKSYWIKPLAVHQSELEEIILLDADDVLLRDPAVLRTTPGYQTHGTLFFYDRVVQRNAYFNRIHKGPDGKPHGRFLAHWLKSFDYARFNLTRAYAPSPRLLASLAYRGKTSHEQDSSMLLVNKRNAANAMAVLWFLITEERFKNKFSWCVCGSGSGAD